MRSRIPNFFIIGAPRCGTTTIVEFLRKQPEIFIPELKEPKFFSVPDNRFPHCGPGDKNVDSAVVKNWDQYMDLFKESRDSSCIVDASIDYLYFPGVARRIHEKSPAAQILIFLRDPVFRAFSAYKYMVWSSRETLSFEEALREEQFRKTSNWEFFWHYKSVGFYCQQVKRYIDVFGKNNVHVILFEDLQSKPTILKKIMKIFGITETRQKLKLKRLNRSGIPRMPWLLHILHTPSILSRVGQRLIPQQPRRKIASILHRINRKKGVFQKSTLFELHDAYVEDILALQSLINQDLSKWLSIKEKIGREGYF